MKKLATNEAESGTVATVGVLDVEPSSINVVPGKATLWVDLRGVDESINCALSDIRDAVSEIAKNDSITITMDMLTADNPVALSEELAAKLNVICAAKGIAYRHMGLMEPATIACTWLNWLLQVCCLSPVKAASAITRQNMLTTKIFVWRSRFWRKL